MKGRDAIASIMTNTVLCNRWSEVFHVEKINLLPSY